MPHAMIAVIAVIAVTAVIAVIAVTAVIAVIAVTAVIAVIAVTAVIAVIAGCLLSPVGHCPHACRSPWSNATIHACAIASSLQRTFVDGSILQACSRPRM